MYWEFLKFLPIYFSLTLNCSHVFTMQPMVVLSSSLTVGCECHSVSCSQFWRSPIHFQGCLVASAANSTPFQPVPCYGKDKRNLASFYRWSCDLDTNSRAVQAVRWESLKEEWDQKTPLRSQSKTLCLEVRDLIHMHPLLFLQWQGETEERN